MNATEQVALWLSNSHKAVAFSGAGISTESGIPDYRSPGGVWANNQPVYFDDFLASADSRYEYWRQKSISQAEFETTLPNQAHAVLAKWESQAKLRGVVTQNIDEKHQEAGSENVLELHGTARKVSCLECHAFFPATPWVEQFLETDVVPDCPECGGLLKHATVSFGQQLPEGTLLQAMSWAKQADLFFALGSSLVVHPAASLPQIAKEAGARLVIINNTETPLDRMADLVIREPLGETMSAIDEAFQARIN